MKKQKQNWIKTEEIETEYEELQTKTKPLFKKKDLTTKELIQVQDFVISSLYV